MKVIAWGAFRIDKSVPCWASTNWQTEAFLKERGVPVNYSAANLEADSATLDKILAGS